MNENMITNFQFKIILIGEFAVGKTSLITNFIENRFTEDYKPTIGTNIFIKKLIVDNYRIITSIWDIAGQERWEKMRYAYYKGAHGVFIVGDLSRKSTFKKIEGFWGPDFYKHVSENVPTIILANKNDLKSEIDDYAIKDIARNINALSVIKTSAKTSSNVNGAFLLLLKRIIEKNMEKLSN